jgi:putative membrane protein
LVRSAATPPVTARPRLITYFGDNVRMQEAAAGGTSAPKAAPVPRREPLVLLGAAVVLLLGSGISPFDRFTWLLEVAPILIGAPILVLTYRRFPLTPLSYRLLFLHALILMLGGKYTYARVPLGFWMQEAFGFARNHYYRIGHLAQGFVPAMVARELLLRKTPLRPGGWLFFLTTCVCLAISAFYEFIEWWTALASGAAATDFLGTQGDPWDTQWDMFLAFVGAIAAQLLLSRLQDRQVERLKRTVKASS